MRRKRLYLRLDDRVVHLRQGGWGTGRVVEERHSRLEGGISIVRIAFEDGRERSFLNDLNSETCCYYSGVRLTCRG